MNVSLSVRKTFTYTSQGDLQSQFSVDKTTLGGNNGPYMITLIEMWMEADILTP